MRLRPGQPRPNNPGEHEGGENSDEAQAEEGTRGCQDDSEDEGYSTETEPAAIILKIWMLYLLYDITPGRLGVTILSMSGLLDD